MGGALRFNFGKFGKLLTKTATGTFTITGFYGQADGTLTRVAVSEATQNTPTWETATVPEFKLTNSGTECYGALFHISFITPREFVVLVERVASGGSAPTAGDMAVTWTRRGHSA